MGTFLLGDVSMETFRIQSLARLTGVSVFQLKYWDQTDLLKPSVKHAAGRGFPRLYSEEDVIAAQTVGKLRKRGISLQKIRRAVAYLADTMPDSYILAECNFTTDGKNIFLSEKNSLVDVSSKDQLGLPLIEKKK